MIRKIVFKKMMFLVFLFFNGIVLGLPAFAQQEMSIEKLTELIDKDSNNAQLYIKRGNAYFEKNEFFDAVEDFTLAIELDAGADEAYFGRGLALARQGLIDDGIADLSKFISRNPQSSLAYTKRGVRYMWKQDFANAEKDLSKAVKLDPGNAEAHDDLGVIYARRHEYQTAIEHFSATIKLDSSYQKGYHNLAMAQYLSGQDLNALVNVNKAIALNPNHKDAVLLKSEIFKALGRIEEAAALKEEAAFLPETNWSEGVAVQ